MRVLQLIQRPQLRGAEIFACQLSLELQQLGMQVDLIYLFGDKPSDWPFPSLNIRGLGADKRKRFWDFASYKRLNAIIEVGKYDLVQANAADTLKYAVLSKKFFGYGCPLVYRNANKMSDFFRSSFHRKYTQWLLTGCDYFISVSENCRRDLITIVEKAKEKSATISIGTKLFDEIEPFQEASKGEPLIVSIGTLVPEKNHIFLIDIFHAFYIRHNKGRLWIVGDGPLRMRLEEKVKSLGLADRVLFWGYRSDVIPILKSTDVMLMPSKIEGLPGVILEAMSCRIPVVASDVGGIREILHHGITGFCLKNWDIENYLFCLEAVLFDENTRSEIVCNASKIVTEKYLIRNVAVLFKDYYTNVVETN